MRIRNALASHCVAWPPSAFALHCIALQCIALHCIALHGIVFACHCTAFQCIVLCFIALLTRTTLSQQQTWPIAHVLKPLNAFGNLFGNCQNGAKLDLSKKWWICDNFMKEIFTFLEGCLGEDLGGVRPGSVTSMALFKNVDFPQVLLTCCSVTPMELF